MEISRHHDIKGFRVIVGEIFNCKGKYIPTPSEVLSLEYNNTRISIAHLCQRYPLDIGESKFFLHALQVFIKTCDIGDDWSNVTLAEFNEFLIDRGSNPLEGVITELLHDGISMFCMRKASIRIQSSLRKFSACLRSKRMIHSTMMIRRCLSNYIHRKVKKNLVCSVIKIQSFIRRYHIRKTMEDSNLKIQAIHRGSGLQFKCMKYCGDIAKTLLQRLSTQEIVVEYSGRPGIKRKAVDRDVRVIDNICEELYWDVQSLNEEMLLHGINDAIEDTVTDRYMDSDPTLMNWMVTMWIMDWISP